jgi:hypothetical protein
MKRNPKQWLLLQLSVFTGCSTLMLVSSAQDAHQANTLAAAKKNARFDPDHDNLFTDDDNDPTKIGRGGEKQKSRTAKKCSIPPFQDVNNYPKPEGQEQRCAARGSASTPPLSTLSEATIHSLAEAYAPVLFFHPLEEYHLQTPDAIFEDPSKGALYVDVEGEYLLVDDALNLTTMLLVSKPDIADAGPYFFEYQPPTEDYKQGAGFDFFMDGTSRRRGISRASVYYNVLDTGNGTWVFNYFHYYTWQGQQTFGFGVGDRKYSIVELDPYGSKEGDWESMSVLVCQTTTPSEPIAITYQQHAFAQITDCTMGDCIFWKDSYHAVGFVSLHSKAVYPVSSRNMVYAAYPFNILYFSPGFFFLADQTVYKNEDTGEYRLFFPNSTNLIRHKNPDDIKLNVSPYEEYWQAYGGRWGGSRETGVEPPRVPPRCLNEAQSHYLNQCPQIPLITAILKFLGSYTTEALGGLIPGLGRFLQPGTGATGPARKNFFYDWLPPENALLWDLQFQFTSEETFCKWLGDPVVQLNGDEDNYMPGVVPIVLTVAIRATAAISNIVGFFANLFP